MTPDASCVVECVPSPNHNARRAPLELLILHYTGMPDDDQACRWLCNPDSEVSSHYFVHQDGRILQLVPENERAWHAGVASWKGADDINSRSIGIEIAHPGDPSIPYAAEQIEAVVSLCKSIVERNNIVPENLLGHSDVAPGRKIDPGEHFPWQELYEAGLGHWVEPAPIQDGRFFIEGDIGQPIEAYQSMLALYGYGVEATGHFDQRTKAVTHAFQQHFRPETVDGVADSSTMETLYRLLKALGRDPVPLAPALDVATS
ncbi:MAG: N-acetylmuramoyl-L-alanine amidase [Pseudomonadota bacterium]